MCAHDFEKVVVALLRFTIGSPWRDSGLTSPVSRDWVSGASSCELVFLPELPGIDLVAGTEAIVERRSGFLVQLTEVAGVVDR
jgi:hypothetical protein